MKESQCSKSNLSEIKEENGQKYLCDSAKEKHLPSEHLAYLIDHRGDHLLTSKRVKRAGILIPKI